MKKPDWTKEQEAAILAPPGNLLVTAAAGAGKTAVLVERVIRRVLDPDHPVDIDRLLVVTFTDAAAAEMRQRIAAALEGALGAAPGNAYLERQVALLGRSSIFTLHSFCLKVVRRYFYELGLDPSFRIMDEIEATLLAQEVLEELWEEKYAQEAETGGAFTYLLDCYSGAVSDDNLKELVLKLHEFSRSQTWPEAWLKQAGQAFTLTPEDELETTPWGTKLRQHVRRELEQAIYYLKRAASLASLPGGPGRYLPALEAERAALEEVALRAESGTWEELRQSLAFSFTRLPSVRKSEEVDPAIKERVTNLRNEAKRIVTDLAQDIFGRREEELLTELARLAPAMQALTELALAFGRRFAEVKRARGRLDFADLEHYALKILLAPDARPGVLKPSRLAEEMAEEYAEVLVDEYQDINPVQDAILSLISRQDTPQPRLFLVGDVKQSIYRFRLAEPRLFLSKYTAYSPEGGGQGRRISLRQNFRSRPEVIAAVNFLFRQLFTPEVGSPAYDAEAELTPGAPYPELPEELKGADGPVEVHLLERQVPLPDKEEAENDLSALDLSALEREALLIGRRIQAMVRGTPERPGPEFYVWDKPARSYRPVTYRDIVILLRTVQGRAEVMLEVLRRLEIPAYADLGSGYFNAPEVATMLSLLEVIDNPYQDIPLAAVLRSPLVGLSAEELAEVRLAAPEGQFAQAVRKAAAGGVPSSCQKKLAAFLDRLEGWRTAARRGTVSDLIWRIYRETGYLAYVGGMPAGVQRQANLRVLYDRACQFESYGRPGLFRFLRFLKRLQAEEGDLGTARALGENENVVRIMSIHKSKGLEFPVVFVADLGKKFNFDDLKGEILIHRDLGLGPLVVDLDLRLKYPSLAYRAIQVAGREEILAEELRILYVALTRARERLILVGSVADLHGQCERWARTAGVQGWALPAGDILSARTYLDWLGMALSRHRDGASLRAAGPELPLDPGPRDDPSRWEVHLYPAVEGLAGGAAQEKEGVDASDLAAQKGEAAAELLAAVQERLSWRYPYGLASRLTAKVSVSELKRRPLPGITGEEEEAPGRELYPVRLIQRPRFAQAAGDLGGAERGSAAHLVLQHLDLTRDLTGEGIAAQIEELTARELLSPEQAAAVDVEALAAFFAGPLGRRVVARPEAVRREVPFSLRLPARMVYPEFSLTGAEAEEPILVQGIIDWLVREEDGWLLLDFKTDTVKAGALRERKKLYRRQVAIYALAVAAWSGRPVREAYLYFLALGVAVPVPVSKEKPLFSARDA
jgi:ATP-dependent helicase/nuclease subunit A